MNIIEKLKSLGVEVNSDVEKALGGEYISIQEHEKKVSRAELERDKFKEDFEKANEVIKGFDGKNIEALTKECEELKTKLAESEKTFADKIAKRDYTDAIKEVTRDLKFTSNSAKKSFMLELETNPLEIKDGKVVGFDKFLEDYKNNDIGAFVENDNSAYFSSRIEGNGTDTDPLAKVRAVMGLK